ncbi:MAG: DsbA family protein [Gammaproteobacteria bacterium]
MARADSALSQAEIEKIVHDYIMNNPQVVIDSVNALHAKQQADAAAAQQQALKGSMAALTQDSRDPFIGASAKDADVTLVEFFDYNCGFCKKTMPELLNLVESDKKVRVVMKEYPILSPDSSTAAKFALAVYAVKPAAYLNFHRALMETHRPKSDDVLKKLLTDLGIDPVSVKQQVTSPEITKHLQDNEALAARIGVSGTPTFFIGGELQSSAMSEGMLVERINAIRKQAAVQKSPDVVIHSAPTS